MNGFFTPIQAFQIAKDLHVEKDFLIRVEIEHAHPSLRIQGDSERQQGRTATVSFDLRGSEHGLEDLVAYAKRAEELGWQVQYDGNSGFEVMGEYVG